MLEDTPDGELNKRRVSLREMGQAKRREPSSHSKVHELQVCAEIAVARDSSFPGSQKCKN
jgi:hypothetical protein